MHQRVNVIQIGLMDFVKNELNCKTIAGISLSDVEFDSEIDEMDIMILIRLRVLK